MPAHLFGRHNILGLATLVSLHVWGTGGDIGVTRDGTHSHYLVLPIAALSRKPTTVSMGAAAAVGVPFITANEGLRRAGLRGRGQTVVVFGVNGKVGQAATQLATRAGARVVGVDRHADRYNGHSSSEVTFIDAAQLDIAKRIADVTEGRGATIAYNTVGSPHFTVALESLAIGGTQVLISTINKVVPSDILAFYRRNLNLLGVDSLKLSGSECAAVLNMLLPGFDDGSLRAFDVDEAVLIPLDNAADAYRRVSVGRPNVSSSGFEGRPCTRSS